jgi:hypothetical protein
MAGLLLLLGAHAAAGARPARAGLWLAAAGLARPESAAVLLVIAAIATWTARPGRRIATMAELLVPPALAGGAFVAYDLWASGAPLPATFYAKGAWAPGDLPRRAGVALASILPSVPPFAFGLGWLAAAGLLAAPSERGVSRPGRLAPLLAGTAYLAANLAVLDPRDPGAFYHQRYLLPALPLLLVAVALGADGWGRRLPRGRGAVPAAVAAIALAQAAWTCVPTSRRLHNDVRNINEVQRRIGEWLGERLPPGTRIAATDAGAVRYFSRLPTLDAIGMNTPGMRTPSAEFLQAHPVAALALMPAWFKTPDGARLEEAFRATTSGYTVTSDPAMALQVVLRARGEEGPVRARFGGFRPFALDFVSPPDARSANVRDEP